MSINIRNISPQTQVTAELEYQRLIQESHDLVADLRLFHAILLLMILLIASPIFDPANNYNFGISQSWHGAYFQDQVKLPFNLHALGGFRYDNAVGRDMVNDKTISAEDRFTPRGGLLWQPIPWLSLYGSYTENFGPSNTLFNIDFRI
ncbi:MAG: TonB-dependent receptor [Nitrosomonas sp.]|nr:TonB-dependent receptor [Nitrosomonas sp.]